MTDSLDVQTVIRQAIRRARLRLDLKPTSLGRRMAALGYDWHPQTVFNVESGRRRVVAEELLPLALCLEVSVTELLSPFGGEQAVPPVELRGGDRILGSVVQMSIGSGAAQPWLRWNGDEPVWPSPEMYAELVQLEADIQRARDAADDADSRAQTAWLGGDADDAGEKARISQEAREHWMQLGERFWTLLRDHARPGTQREDEGR